MKLLITILALSVITVVAQDNLHPCQSHDPAHNAQHGMDRYSVNCQQETNEQMQARLNKSQRVRKAKRVKPRRHATVTKSVR